jgi:CRP-like cAMP-binding protein
MFNQVGSFALSQICLLMQEQQLIYGQFLYRSGDTIEKIYVIRTGSFKLMKKIGRTSLSGTASKIEHKIVADPSRNAEYLIVQEGEVLG